MSRLVISFALSAILCSNAVAQNLVDTKSFCVFNGKLFSVGAILCAGEKLGFQCSERPAEKPAQWVTEPTPKPAAPITEGCKVATPTN